MAEDTKKPVEQLVKVQGKVDKATAERMAQLQRRRLWTESLLVRVAVQDYLDRNSDPEEDKRVFGER